MTSSDPKAFPGRTERLPLDFAQVDAAWLTRTLQNQYPGVVVEAMEVVEFIPGHTTKARVSLKLNQAGIDAGLPAAACLKANWSGNAMSSGVCVNEARFYGKLRSRLPLPAPICYFADWDDDATSQQGFILLEDMILRGGSFDTSARAITLDQMYKALEGMATLHGSTWAHPELDRQDWIEVAMAKTTNTDDYWSMMEEYFARHNAIPERVAMFPQWMAEDPTRLRSAWRQLCAYDQASPAPRCLVHGDAHLGNSYSLPDGGRLWFDWQIVRKGRPWRDYSYFLIGSISIEDRRKAERDLLRHYLGCLAKYDIAIDFDEAWSEYRRWVIWGLVGWQSNINPKEETMPPLERFCVAAKDLEIDHFYKF